MEIQKTLIPGCHEIHPKVFRDDRGSFVKTFHQDMFTSRGLNTTFAEEYYSVSYKNVLRGMHFQLPPMAHTKLVYCVLGEVLDVVVDLRVGSPTYGKCQKFELSADKANLVHIPPGLAHGFYVTSEIAIMMYKVSTVYAPNLDVGIRWDSIAFSWPKSDPIMSQRDQNFRTFAEFNSPFHYSPDEHSHE
jgi:dTDP-4-dehydrorhamnose 3,5-epimerase